MNKVWQRRLACILFGYSIGNLINSFTFFDTHNIGLGVDFLVTGVLSAVVSIVLGYSYIQANKEEESNENTSKNR
jgi:cytochrome bd-type quinol oxidase subunit 2